MTNWTSLLNEVIPLRCNSRPFVCRNGFPDADDVIIIGQEVATNLDTNWWNWWNAKTGFDYQRFETDYLEYRRKKGKIYKDGTPKPSDTRICYNLIHKEGINAVETNASHSEVVKLLIENMSLKAIVAHGKDAKDLVDRFQSQRVIALPDARIIRTKHFGRGFSYIGEESDLATLCANIKDCL